MVVDSQSPPEGGASSAHNVWTTGSQRGDEQQRWPMCKRKREDRQDKRGSRKRRGEYHKEPVAFTYWY